MNIEQIKSFIQLVKRGCVEEINLIDYYPEFIKSGSEDAFEFYVSKGLHNLCEPISDIQICSWIHEAIYENPECSLNHLIGIVMKKSRGRLHPDTVKDVVVKFLNGLQL